MSRPPSGRHLPRFTLTGFRKGSAEAEGIGLGYLTYVLSVTCTSFAFYARLSVRLRASHECIYAIGLGGEG